MRSFKAITFLFLLFTTKCFSQNQGINNNWMSGYGSQGGGIPFGISKLDFLNGPPVISYDSFPMEFSATHANISDTAGNLLFYTNGVYVADASNNMMLNGGGLNPSTYTTTFYDGLIIPQGALILPKPGSSTIYYMFHNTMDNYPSVGAYSFHLYLTTIDMSLNGGLGGVVSKNVSVISDSLNCGKITACKAADGVSWWVFAHRVNSDKFYRLLVTSNFILGPYSQNIGSIREWDAGQAKFSPDGSKLAYFHYRFTGLDIFDFNRCTGLLSNYINDNTIPLEIGHVGCAFSANSRVLYVSNVNTIYQYNLIASNIIASRTLVANYDGFNQPGIPNLGAYLCYPELAPDGKIYITTGNSTTYFGCIEYPDTIGVGCNVAQHNIVIPTYNFNTIPNHPNYFLGCADSSLGCNCAITTSLTPDPSPQERGVKVFPNPTSGNFKLQFNVQSTTGIAQIYDINSKLVLQQNIAPWSQYKHLNITNLPQGIYLCKLKWGKTETGVKVIKE